MAFKGKPEAQDVDQQQSTEVALINDRQLLEQFAEMAVMIPADQGAGMENIMHQILQAQTWDDINKPWDASTIDDILGKKLRVTKVTRRPSDIAGGLGMFLVVHLLDPKTQKEYVKTTGSIAVVAQFARLYCLGATALLIEWCRTERPTENGYFPQHIRVWDAHVPDRSDATR